VAAVEDLASAPAAELVAHRAAPGQGAHDLVPGGIAPRAEDVLAGSCGDVADDAQGNGAVVGRDELAAVSLTIWPAPLRSISVQPDASSVQIGLPRIS
jgi:hypothetical protein